MELNKVGVQEINLGTANTYRAASVIAFYNPENAAPYLAVTEITKGLPDSLRSNFELQNSVNLTVPFDPDLQIPMYNPITGEATGTNIGVGELLAFTYSLYMYARSHAVLPGAQGTSFAQ